MNFLFFRVGNVILNFKATVKVPKLLFQVLSWSNTYGCTGALACDNIFE